MGFKETLIYRLVAVVLAAITLAGCSTSESLTAGPVEASWTFSKNYEVVSQCFVRGLNREWEPMSHHIMAAKPGKVNEIINENSSGPQWLVRVTVVDDTRSTAEAFTFPTLDRQILRERIRKVAAECGPDPS